VIVEGTQKVRAGMTVNVIDEAGSKPEPSKPEPSQPAPSQPAPSQPAPSQPTGEKASGVTTPAKPAQASEAKS
jgi:hypothetical protein